MSVAAAASSSALPEGAPPDLGQTERWLSLALGGALLGLVVRRSGAVTLLAGALGAALLARGVTRRDPVMRVLRRTETERQAARQRGWRDAAIVTGDVVIDRPPAEVYALWRDFSNLPRFLHGVRRIDMVDGQRSRWSLGAPGGMTVNWEAVIVRDEPDRRIGWESEEGGDIRNAGDVVFRPLRSGRATSVEVRIDYEPPAGALGRAAVAMIRQKPRLQVREGLERLKALMEEET